MDNGIPEYLQNIHQRQLNDFKIALEKLASAEVELINKHKEVDEFMQKIILRDSQNHVMSAELSKKSEEINRNISTSQARVDSAESKYQEVKESESKVNERQAILDRDFGIVNLQREELEVLKKTLAKREAECLVDERRVMAMRKEVEKLARANKVEEILKSG